MSFSCFSRTLFLWRSLSFRPRYWFLFLFFLWSAVRTSLGVFSSDQCASQVFRANAAQRSHDWQIPAHRLISSYYRDLPWSFQVTHRVHLMFLRLTWNSPSVMSDSEPPKKRFCGHCKEYLCKTVYFQHKRLYFNKKSNEWLATQIFNKSPFDEAAFHPVSTAAEPKQASVLLSTLKLKWILVVFLVKIMYLWSLTSY